MNFLLLAADFTPVSAPWQADFYSVLLLISLLLGLYGALKRKPPLEVELTKFTLAIKQLGVVVAELEKSCKEILGHRERIATLERETRKLFIIMADLEKSVGNNFQSVERGLGKHEGAIEQIADRLHQQGR